MNAARYGGLPVSLQRAAKDIYLSLRQSGSSVRAWLVLSGVTRTGPGFQTSWALASQVDFWIARESRSPPIG